MKCLLSILVLFSGLSFADEQREPFFDNYLICDEPYIFYPSLVERWLIQFDDEKYTEGYINAYSDKYLELGEYKVSVFIGEKEISFDYGIGKDVILNRTSMKLNDGKQCKKVPENEYIWEEIRLEEFAEEQRAKRKI